MSQYTVNPAKITVFGGSKIRELERTIRDQIIAINDLKKEIDRLKRDNTLIRHDGSVAVEKLEIKLQDQDTEIQRQALVIENLKGINKELREQMHEDFARSLDKENQYQAKVTKLLGYLDTANEEKKEMNRDIRIYKDLQEEAVEKEEKLERELTYLQHQLLRLRHNAIAAHDIDSNGHHGG